ncbi:phospholipase A [Dongshaea marina]|uniref:phospholipase A n=1 Tax=Dongshaea marina TaxID=2047966 RepID=UPI00131EF8A7|nr:phospholipase A [Dongshaea marina]
MNKKISTVLAGLMISPLSLAVQAQEPVTQTSATNAQLVKQQAETIRTQVAQLQQQAQQLAAQKEQLDKLQALLVQSKQPVSHSEPEHAQALQKKSEQIAKAQENLDQQQDKIEQSKRDLVFRPYKPSYFLPFYYTQMPQQTGVSEELNKRQEIKFQFSFQTPLWENILGSNFSWDFAYTQLSYWQAYAESAFFRETNYEPEMFVRYDFKDEKPFYIDSIRSGFVHQSNGRGGDLERSWNRVYANVNFQFNDHWELQLEPWVRLHGFMESRDYNPDIYDYLGHGQFIIDYKVHGNTFSLISRNNLESGFSKGSTQLSWSFPIYEHLHGYVQLFTGYGQSLIEYNHYTNSAGIGFSFTDW